MNSQQISALTPHFLSIIISVLMGLAIFKKRSTPGVASFSFLVLFETIWIFACICQQITTTFEWKLFWNNVQFFGAVMAPLSFFWFSFHFSNHQTGPRKSLIWVTHLSSFGLLAIIWTDSLHHLFRQSPKIVDGSPFLLLSFGQGPLFFLFPLVCYATLSIGALFMIARYRSSSKIFRGQIGAVLLGISLPWVASVVTWFDWVSLQVHDIPPLTFGLSNLIVGLALIYFRLFELVPIAHHTVVEQMKDGIIVLNNHWTLIDINPSALEFFSENSEDLIGHSFKEAHPALYDLCQSSTDLGIDKLTYTNEKSKRVYEARVIKLLNGLSQTSGFLLTLHDITLHKETEAELTQMAITDSLTGIFNRRYFYQVAAKQLSDAQENGSPLSIIYLDIDFFKNVNDQFGHSIGDQVLQIFTSRCQDELRNTDLLARYGGEEFIILLPHTPENQAAQTAERIRRKIEQHPISIAGESITLTISIGVSSTEHLKVTSVDQLIHWTDQALYEAKAAGRNQIIVYQPRALLNS